MNPHVPAPEGSITGAAPGSHFPVHSQAKVLEPLSPSVLTERRALRSVIILFGLTGLVVFGIVLILPL